MNLAQIVKLKLLKIKLLYIYSNCNKHLYILFNLLYEYYIERGALVFRAAICQNVLTEDLLNFSLVKISGYTLPV